MGENALPELLAPYGAIYGNAHHPPYKRVTRHRLQPSDANGDRLFVAIHHIQHGIFGPRSVVGSDQGALSSKDVDGISVRRGHEAEAMGWNVASFVPGVCTNVVDLDISW